ncbi:hypothetical protein HDU78_008130 [Chytriomyces hyalinus]|nr:hypothetical protein HDU78_008130 [Chytriomyces hyalinus]
MSNTGTNTNNGNNTTVRVAVRIRPLSAKERLGNGGGDNESSECVSVHAHVPNTLVVQSTDPSHSCASLPGHPSAPRVFAFDHIFGCDSTQSGVYEGCVKILVQRFVAGFNATVLAYGQTGSGKTWTMGTGLEASSTVMNDSVGIVPRAISDMFSLLAEKENTRFSLFVSFLELYNEDIVDLLNPSTVVNARRPSSAASSASSINASISIREDARGNIVFGGVREEPVSSPADMLSLLQKGSLCRATGSTDMNAASSRSHAIFSIILKQHVTTTIASAPAIADSSDQQSLQPLASAEPESSISSTSTLTSKFHFVDLAGSERLKRTNAHGDRKKEGISINQGLLALGNVISALGNTEDSSETSTHVPYRDSKLTRMLQDSLGGNSQTLMIACVSPSDLSYGETVSTLTYANRARNIKNKAVVNRDIGSNSGLGAAGEKEIRALRALVADLRDEIMSLRGGGPGSGVSSFGPGSSNFSAESAWNKDLSSGSRGVNDGVRPGSATMMNSEGVAQAIRAHERDFQLHLQEERDLTRALEAAQQEIRIVRFDGDRFGFHSVRLMERCSGLNEQVANLTVERDAAMVELEQWRSGKLRLKRSCGCVETKIVADTSTVAHQAQGTQELMSGDLSEDTAAKAKQSEIKSSEDMSLDTAEALPDSSSSSSSLSLQMIQDYNNAISDLKSRLAETSDRLAWYNEVVSSFGNEESRRQNILSRFESAHTAGGIALDTPAPKIFQDIQSEESAFHEISHESQLWKALKQDSELDQVLSSSETEEYLADSTAFTTSDGTRLFGIPKNASESLTPSRLAQSTATNTITTIHEEEEGDESHDASADDDMDDSAYLDELSHDNIDPDNRPLPSSNIARDPTHDGTQDKSTDMYMLIHRLQSDIAQHQALIDKQNRAQQEYEALRAAYENKLEVLQAQLSNVGKERDEAMKRIKSSGRGGVERPGTAAVKQRFDEQKRKLEAQIADYKRKMADGAKASVERKNEGLTKQLMQTIDALKAEKLKALKELKKEANRTRDLKTAKEREIARLKRSEKTATERAKRLEQSFQLQKVVLKRRSEEFISRHSRQKTAMSVLKRSGSASSLSGSKSNRNKSGALSPTQQLLRSHSATTRSSGMAKKRARGEEMALLKAFGAGAAAAAAGLNHDDEPPMEIKAKFKKQMIEKELATAVTFRIAALELDVMKGARDRLIGEQKELLAERDRCVEAEAQVTGVWDTQKPQYMDDRLGVIDMEVAMANARIRNMEDEIRLGRAAASLSSLGSSDQGSMSPTSIGFATGLTHADLGWDNAVNLTKSLDIVELEFVAILFLEDMVDCKIHVQSLERKLADYEKSVTELRASMSTMRSAALQTAIAYRKELETIRVLAAEKISEAIAEATAVKPTPQRGMTASRSKSTLFSFDEYGSATPKLQKMFDAAYGSGFVVLQPTVRHPMTASMSDDTSAELRRSVAKALEKTPARHVSLSSMAGSDGDVSVTKDADEESLDEEFTPSSPVARKSPAARNLVQEAETNESDALPSLADDGTAGPNISANKLETTAVPEPPRYLLRRRGKKASSEVINASVAASAAEPFLEEPLEQDRGRKETRFPPGVTQSVRAMSVPSSPVDPNSDKFIIKNFINARRNRATVKVLDFGNSEASGTVESCEAGITGQTKDLSPADDAIDIDRGSSSMAPPSDSSNLQPEDSLEETNTHNVRKRASKAALDGAYHNDGTDVFARLATSHTLASQAKVIHRDKDGGIVGLHETTSVAPVHVDKIRKLSLTGVDGKSNLAGDNASKKDKLEPAAEEKDVDGDPETAKLVYGVVFSLRNMANKLSNQGFTSYKTATYKLHYFESPAGPKLVLITDPNAPNMAGTLQSIYANVYVEHVVKNALVKPNTPIRNQLFRTTLDKYVRNLPNFE